ncbi:PREDICTED: orofacial cleft 1 candidate gene 1 protein homolog [Gekko japonicus]|uniref:Orofacial cleft 1 candidate gene 1 protein homolog n=1 Tax=Gekko japonicus TaxID=146911 RepID=A0ABM1KD46_GEKJA|nr:PREDICTED: orofacial cleft 1 candidate gene 1 protein homolog [Gekko japonicus]
MRVIPGHALGLGIPLDPHVKIPHEDPQLRKMGTRAGFPDNGTGPMLILPSCDKENNETSPRANPFERCHVAQHRKDGKRGGAVPLVTAEAFPYFCVSEMQGQEGTGEEKFQQKAQKQTKQKKSKSAEFLMGKEERAATEGIANPAFNISSTDLSASQTSEEEIIRHDKLDRTRAAHQQKLGLQAQAEPRGNECSRNYFDPLMDEEINPRQCGMEVSEEGEVELNERLVYEKLMTLFYEENSMTGSRVPKDDEGISDSVHPVSYSRTGDLCEEIEDEETLPYIEHFDKEVQDEMIVLDNLLLEQVRMKNQENASPEPPL